MPTKREYQGYGYADGYSAASGEAIVRTFQPGHESWQAKAYNEGWEAGVQAFGRSPTGRITDDNKVVLNNALDQAQGLTRTTQALQTMADGGKDIANAFKPLLPSSRGALAGRELGKSIMPKLAHLMQYPSEPPAGWPHGAREHYKVLLKMMAGCEDPRRYARMQQSINRLKERHGA